MNNKKRPAVSDNTLTRRYSRRSISANNNVEQIASLDDCVDDIILSIASYLTSCELFNFALTCKRFGARRSTVSADDDEQQDGDDIIDTNGILQNGSRAFARPSSSETNHIYRYHRHRDREGTFMACEITDHSHITESYTVKFDNETYGTQWVDQKQVVSIEDMTKRVNQSLRFCVNRKRDGDGDTISIRWEFMADNQPWKIESEFVEPIATSMRKRMDASLENKDWSLVEEAALQKSLSLLPKDGCLMWREGESWMGVCHQFEKELNRLIEEDCELEKEEPDETDATDLHQFLDKATELSQYYEDDIAQLVSGGTIATSFFQRYSNTPSNYPVKVKECHMRGVSSMVGLYENAMSGVLIDDDNGRSIQTVLLLACLRSEGITGPFVIVAPLSLVPAWIGTFKLYTNMPVACLVGTEKERKSMYSGRLNSSLSDYGGSGGERSTDFPVIITSYEAAINDSLQLKNIGVFKYFIMDEGRGFDRYIRELLSLYFSKRFMADNGLFLTSGPIKSDLKELTVLWRFCNPRIFMGNNYVEHILDDYDDNEKQTIAAKLQNILKPHIVSSRENREGTSSVN